MGQAPPSTGELPTKGAIVRNVAILMGSQVSTWALSVIAAVVIPRFLGAEVLGRFHLASSLWAFGAVIIGFGMSLVVTKGVARDRTKVGALLGACILGRLILAVPVTFVLFGYAVAVGYPNELLALLVLVGLGVLVASVSDAIAAVLQGLDRMGAMSVAIVLGRVVFVAGAVGLLLLGFGVYAVAAIATVGFVSTLALQVVLLQRVRREYGDTGRLSFDRGDLLDLGQQSMPYFWIALSIVVYQQVDTIIISLVVDGDEVLGWYSVYERLAGTLMFVPTVFVVAIFPALARLYGDPELDMSSGGLSGRMIRKAVSTMLLVSVPLGFGAAVVAGPLVELLYGDDFADAAPVVSVGGVVLSLTYLTTVLGTFLIAMDKQRQWTRFIVLGGVLTVPLDLALVPAFETGWNNGALGAVLGYLVTESIVLAGAIYLLPAGSLDRASLWFAVRVVVAGIVMALVVHSLGSVMLPARVAIGAVVYAVMVGLLGLISTEDRQLIRTQLRTRRPSS